MNKKYMDELREDSGAVRSKDPLASILYSLIRDGHLSIGELEREVQEQLKLNDSGNLEILYSNGWLAQYCIYTSERIYRKEDK